MPNWRDAVFQIPIELKYTLQFQYIIIMCVTSYCTDVHTYPLAVSSLISLTIPTKDVAVMCVMYACIVGEIASTASCPNHSQKKCFPIQSAWTEGGKKRTPETGKKNRKEKIAEFQITERSSDKRRIVTSQIALGSTHICFACLSHMTILTTRPFRDGAPFLLLI